MYLGIPVFDSKTTGNFIKAEFLLDSPALFCSVIKLPINSHRSEQVESVVAIGLKLRWWFNPHFTLLFFETSLAVYQVLIDIVVELSKRLSYLNSSKNAI